MLDEGVQRVDWSLLRGAYQLPTICTYASVLSLPADSHPNDQT